MMIADPVVLCAFFFFLGLYIFKPKYYGCDTVPLAHAVLAGSISNYIWANRSLSSWVDDLLSCDYSPTYLESLVPMITFSYGLFDIVQGFRDGTQFLLHGIALTAICISLYVVDGLHYFTIALLMEMSTIFLNLRPLNSLVIDICFAGLFFFYRWFIVPYAWIQFILAGYPNGACGNVLVFQVTLFGGVFFHGLNLYWGVKIGSKIIKKCGKKRD